MDHRIKEGICGVTHTGATAIEWICIRKPHAEVYTRNTSDRTHKKGDLIFSTAPKADQHYYVIRWRNRPDEESL